MSVIVLATLFTAVQR